MNAAPELAARVRVGASSAPHEAVVYRITAQRAAELARRVQAIRARLLAVDDPADAKHVLRISRLGRALSCAGYALCALGFALAPLAAVLIALGRFTRWVLVAHPVLHCAYDRCRNAGAFRSRTFARGTRRFIDWFDWLLADEWQAQHNVEHHCYVGDERDPDRLTINLEWLKAHNKWWRALVLALTAMTWKWSYYGPATRRAMLRRKRRSAQLNDSRSPAARSSARFDTALLVKAYAPYAVFHFVLLPCAFWPFGTSAVAAAAIGSLLGEVLVNAHAFAVVAPSHTGLDIPIFEGSAKSREEYYLRQILGAVNYQSAGIVSDFLQGYMGYQIEHHMWPDVPLRRYPALSAEMAAICGACGLPYRKGTLSSRVYAMIEAVLGDARPRIARIEIVE